MNVFRAPKIFLLMILFLLAGCTPPTFFQAQHQQDDFIQALDLYLLEQNHQQLAVLAKIQPETEWYQRAAKLLEHMAALKTAQKTVDQLSTEQHICTQQVQLLEQENLDLKETMEQLKQLFIDMELRE